MLEKKILLVLASVSLTALIGCSSGGGGGGEDLDIAEIQEIEQTGEFSEDEFFASEDVDNLDEEQLVDDVPGLEEDLQVGQDDFESSGDEGFEIDLAEEEQDLFEESGLADEEFTEEGAIAQNQDISEDELDSLLEEDLGEDDFFTEDSAGDESFNNEQLALDSEEDLFRDLEDESTGETFSDTTSEPSASELLADEQMDYSSEASQNYQDSSNDMVAEDINVDVDYSQALAEDTSLGVAGAAETAPKTYIPVKKMKTVPYDRNGVLVNAIYFVREGDTLRGIADKVYGSGSAVDFTIVNPHLSAGNLRVGQKVYYNSPIRPQDRSRLLTYYEDARAPIMSYAANEGENIREISKTLLGHPRSWMEIWASNLEIESKGALESPYQIRYWQGAPAGTSAPVLADTQTPTNVNQANLDMNNEPDMNELSGDFEDPAQEVAINDEPNFDANTLEEPVIEDDFSDELNQDLAAVGTIEEPASDLGGDTFNDTNNNQAGLDQGFDGEIAENDPLTGEAVPNPETNPRNVALNNTGGGFPSQNSGGIEAIMNDPGQMGVIGAALLVLLGIGFIVIRRRRASAEEAIEMESFDFGGETVIEDEVNKTQVDI